MPWVEMIEAIGSTPMHSDEQLAALAADYKARALANQGIAFIQFARAPLCYGYARMLHPYKIITNKERTHVDTYSAYRGNTEHR